MKKINFFYLLGIVLIGASLTLSSCKKDDDPAPAPPAPAPYTPAFSPTYLVVNTGGAELLDFYITCTTDDWEMIKVIVTYPGGLGNEEYFGSGQIVTAGTPFTFPDYFVKLGGTWTFRITGNIKSGTHVGTSFTVTTTVNVTGK